MKLLRIRIEQFKQFRQTLEIDELEPGLNIFTGSNEAGKSTIVAAIRAAFFERHRSGSLAELRPWGDSSASPKVTIEFMIHNQHYRLTKSFLTNKRCELQEGTLRLDGVEAEDHLALLLGFELASKGASKAEHWGIPGLLWIEQGRTQELRDPVAHAADRLSAALHASLGEIAGTGGDEVLAAIEAQRNELLTPSSGAARGIYAEARNREARLSEQISTLSEQIDSYSHDVDNFAAMRQAYAQNETDQPWLALREQQRNAEQALDAIAGMQQSLQADQQRAIELQERLKLLRGQLEEFDNQTHDLARRREALAAAEALRASAEQQLRQWREKYSQALQHDARARTTARLARQEHARNALSREAQEARCKADEVAALLARAEEHLAHRLQLQAQAATIEISAQDLETLRRQAERLRELRIQQQAAATRLHFRLEPHRTIHLGQEELDGEGERLLLAPTSLSLPGLGTLQITPGGMDLAQLEREAAQCEERHLALLRHLDVASLELARARHDRHRQLLTAIDSVNLTLEALVPQGIDALRTQLLKHQAQAAASKAELHKLPAPLALRQQSSADLLERSSRRDPGSSPDAIDEFAGNAGPAPGIDAAALAMPVAETTRGTSGARITGTIPDVADAEAEEEASREALERFVQALNDAQLRAAGALHTQESAQRELAHTQALLEAPARAERIRKISQQLIDARAQYAALEERMQQRALAIEQARPKTLQQDVERFRRSAEQQEKLFREQREALLRLEVKLQSAGALGLEQRRAELQRDHAQALRRVDELHRRATALDHLLKLLKEKRNCLTSRLRAPLQKHLNHHLQLLFPQAHLQIDENLSPAILRRSGTDDGELESMSFGAREQIGLISRLAYADLLKETGNPTLIIMDDALVHSDALRLACMKRVLFDAATRHQILLFTCHPERWRDMGVATRELARLRSQH